jgi:hypothetical protein
MYIQKKKRILALHIFDMYIISNSGIGSVILIYTVHNSGSCKCHIDYHKHVQIKAHLA